MPEASRADADRVLAERYRLVRCLARGTTAEVWEAADLTLGRRVALKLLLPELAADDARAELFHQEAVSAARLAHPNVVETYDAGRDGDGAYLVTELVGGTSLREILAAEGALPPGRAVRIASQVAAALDHAHQQGILHGDIRPSNILVRDDDRVKVGDFAIARATERLDRSPGGSTAAAAYRAPEQLRGDAVDARADVYSLGAVLYEMLCGHPPVDPTATTVDEGATARTTLLGPRQIRAGIPRPLDGAILRALEAAPDDRFGSAAELQSALLSIDFGPDDAVSMVVRDTTPPEGVSRVRFHHTERNWMWPTAFIVIVAVTLGVVGLLFATTETGQRFLNLGPDSPDAQAADTEDLTITATRSFDPPPGSGEEHDEELANLHDGDPATTWSTETYFSSRFGGLKQGVGVVVELDEVRSLDEVTLVSPTRGWGVEIYVAESPRNALPGWGQPVAAKSTIDGTTTTLALRGREGRAVLVWIADLGASNRSVSLGEVRLRG